MPPDGLPPLVLHDMNGAVAAVSGIAETLAEHRDDLGREEQDLLFGALRRQAGLLRRLVADLADLEHLESGAFAVDLGPVDVGSVVQAAVAQATPDHVVKVRVPDDLLVRADPQRLQQVMVNLLANARVHGGPTAWVDAHRRGRHTTIAVSDDGHGLDAASAADVFEPYRRGPGADPATGMGLGLAIVRGLVDAFGGQVRYVARPGGSQFLVDLETVDPGHEPTGADRVPVPRRGDPHLLPPFDHAVLLYEDDGELEGEVARMVAAGLAAGDGVIVVATPAHWSGARGRLARLGVDVAAAARSGQLAVRDAAATLRTFDDGPVLDPVRFDRVVGELVTATARRFGDVQIFGEMVALLWEGGDVLGALALEELWNELYTRHRFGLLCGYRVDASAGDSRLDLRPVCEQHGLVLSA